MTKYRLKDQELQKKLDEISGGEFSKNLHEFDENHFASYWGKTIFFTTNEDDDGEELEEPKYIREPQFGVWFNIDELEEVPEYNPNDWNVFPDVTPPEGVLMRVEFVYNGILRRNCAIFENGAWHITAEGKADYDHLTLDDVKRFRPWE